MKHKRTFFTLSLAVAIFILSSACLWPAVSASSELSTIVTQTWEALSRFSSQSSEEPPAVVDESQAQEEIAPSATSTPGPPMIHVTVDTNCRSGPGLLYEYLGALMTYEEAEVLARGNEPGFWVIENPDQPGSECWVGEQYAMIEGDTSGLPVRTPPPTPTPEEPAQTIGSISGYAYLDDNDNGQFDSPPDIAAPNQTIMLREGSCPSEPFISNIKAQTDSSGYYIFQNLTPGTYCLATQSFFFVPLHEIDLGAGEHISGVNFRKAP